LKNRVHTEGTENTEKRLKKARGADFQSAYLFENALGAPTLKSACLKSESQERAHRWISLVSRDFVGSEVSPLVTPR
jgi:hypothetical protein